MCGDSNLTTTNAATLNSGTRFTVDTNSLNATWGGVLSGRWRAYKVGTGTLTLSAANTYTGATTISGGTLALTGNGGLSTATALTNNGRFDISGVTVGGVTIGSLSGNGTVINGPERPGRWFR